MSSSGLSFRPRVCFWGILFCTRWGLALRAVGEDPAAAFAAGRDPKWLQYQALALAGFLAGVGSPCLVGLTQTWDEGMTAGRGFIAIALVIFSKWNPLWVIAGALVFGGAETLQLQLQARGARRFALPHDDGSLSSDAANSRVLVDRAFRRALPALGRNFFGVE